METISNNDFSQAVVRLLRELLTSGEEVQIEGLGVFSVSHKLSWVDRNERGDYVLLPPRDSVSFKPE